jgi:60 kDa SS-A/Ro ribonucleoprotein
MKTNVKTTVHVATLTGQTASPVNAKEQLKRSVMSCLLWENQFYEDGVDIATRVAELCKVVKAEDIAEIAIEARHKMHLRHMPLYLLVQAARNKKLSAKTVTDVITRADELAELVAIYWKDGKVPLSHAIKKGLADSFHKFNEYGFAKYNRDADVKLRDVMFLAHPKPRTEEQKALFSRIASDTLATPETWEVLMSGKGNTKENWEKLLDENKLYAMALLRNLRNMTQAKVDQEKIANALNNADYSRVLPFRFLSAAKAVPQIEDKVELGLKLCLAGKPKLPGTTILVIDVSGSMYNSSVSVKSGMSRADVACSLGMLVRELAENPIIFATAGSDARYVHATSLVPPRRFFALRDAIYSMCKPLGGGGIFLKQVMDYIAKEVGHQPDRVIIITDEEDCDGGNPERSPNKAIAFGKQNYIINVASGQYGIAYQKFTHINGWSDAVIDYIIESEKLGTSMRQ